MNEVLEADRPWLHMMALLSQDGLIQAPSHCHARADHRDGSYPACAIKVLERHGPAAATVAWRDSTACCYGEQIWRRCVARKSGICALSGQSIAQGDSVYRPRLVQPAPRNIEAMILASEIETIPLADVA